MEYTESNIFYGNEHPSSPPGRDRPGDIDIPLSLALSHFVRPFIVIAGLFSASGPRRTQEKLSRVASQPFRRASCIHSSCPQGAGIFGHRSLPPVVPGFVGTFRLFSICLRCCCGIYVKLERPLVPWNLHKCRVGRLPLTTVCSWTRQDRIYSSVSSEKRGVDRQYTYFTQKCLGHESHAKSVGERRCHVLDHAHCVTNFRSVSRPFPKTPAD